MVLRPKPTTEQSTHTCLGGKQDDVPYNFGSSCEQVTDVIQVEDLPRTAMTADPMINGALVLYFADCQTVTQMEIAARLFGGTVIL